MYVREHETTRRNTSMRLKSFPAMRQALHMQWFQLAFASGHRTSDGFNIHHAAQTLLYDHAPHDSIYKINSKHLKVTKMPQSKNNEAPLYFNHASFISACALGPLVLAIDAFIPYLGALLVHGRTFLRGNGCCLLVPLNNWHLWLPSDSSFVSRDIS